MAKILDALEPEGAQDDGTVIERLSGHDWVNSWTAGAHRVVENLHRADSSDYSNGLNAPEHIAQPLSVMCEVAVARHLNIDWDWDDAWWESKDHKKKRHLVDVGTNIEVRRITKPHSNASLRKNQLGKGLTLVVAYAMPSEYFNIKIVGIKNYDEAWELGKPAMYGGKPSPTKRTIAKKDLDSCHCYGTGLSGVYGHADITKPLPR